MPPMTLDYGPPAEFDTGRFVARYLQVAAWASIAWMIAGPVFLGGFHLDVSPIFMFWAASGLKRQSRTARKWVLWLSGLALALIVMFVVWAVIAGTDHLVVTMGRETIHQPALWQVAAVSFPIGALIGIPFVVLMSDSARRQFAKGPVSAYANGQVADRLSDM